MFSKLLSWIIAAPLALIIIAFAISNRSAVILALWPLPFTIEVPIFAAVLGGAIVSFFIGGIIAWISASKARSRARSLAHRLAAAEREINMLNDKLAKLEARPADDNAPALPAPDKAA